MSSLAYNDSLLDLNLQENLLNDLTGKELLESLKTNKKLIKVNLKQTHINLRVQREIAKKLHAN